jgi:ElaB/YqjD/DUF883 family membrane-anchored ribosome-binding protein
MNGHISGKKVRQDAAKIKTNITALVEDSADQLSRLEKNVGQTTDKAKEHFRVWMDHGILHVDTRLKKLANSTRETIDDTAAAVKKEASHTLSQYNATLQAAVGRKPDSLGKKIARYPWVTISIGLAVGFVLGLLLKPARQPIDQF